MANPSPSPKTRFKKGVSGNATGKLPTPPNAREFLNANTLAGLVKLWAFTDHQDPDVALRAIIAFLKKTTPDLSNMELAANVEAKLTGNATADEALAKIRFMLDAARKNVAKRD